MISTNDTTILAMLSRYPNLSDEEVDININNIENEENIAICHAVVGRIDREDLPEDSRVVFDEFKRWADDRTTRTRNEQIHARQNNRETRTSQRMMELHNQGVISDEILLLYGISGPLPERNAYNGMSRNNQTRIWTERLERRFGQNWRNNFRLSNMFPPAQKINWKREGF